MAGIVVHVASGHGQSITEVAHVASGHGQSIAEVAHVASGHGQSIAEAEVQVADLGRQTLYLLSEELQVAQMTG